MSITFTNQREFTIDNVSIPNWEIEDVDCLELIQINENHLRLRVFFEAFFYDQSFNDVEGLYEYDYGDNELEIDEISCKFEFQVDFDIRNLSQEGSIKSIDFEVLNIADIDYQIPVGYAHLEINDAVLDREIYDTLKRETMDSTYGIGREGFTLSYSAS